MRPPQLLGPVRSIALSAALVVGVAACGSDGTPAATPDVTEDAAASSGSDVTGSDVAGSDVTESAGAAGDVGAAGEGRSTLTLVDGTTYEFMMSICETSNTDDFVIPDSYELLGATADGAFRFSLTRVGLDEEFITQVGTLEGDFDDNGNNNAMLYTAELGDDPLSVDGAIVSGTFLMNAIGPTRPHGDQVGVILDARC